MNLSSFVVQESSLILYDYVMTIEIEPGKYVVAVSGGVDSVVLLDLLATNFKLQTTPKTQFEFLIAHFDHGIRSDSDKDRHFVEDLAKKYGLPFESKREELGKDASEEQARIRRYEFLNNVKKKHQAKAIITAHHKDDVTETALINMVRGTGRSGLSSLKSQEIIRPLLKFNKNQIIEYAQKNNLAWREDPTNQDTKYLRNKLRKIMSKSDDEAKENLQKLINDGADRNQEIDKLLAGLIETATNDDNKINRSFFIALGYQVSCELIAYLLRKNGISFDKKRIDLAVVFLKTADNNKKFEINKNNHLLIQGKQISLINTTSV